jgi:large-conductance mechanosensitive channel
MEYELTMAMTKVETMPEAEAESEVELLKEIRDLLSKED